MTFTLGFVIVGLLLVAMALMGSLVHRLPVSTAMLYIAVGLALGPFGIGLIMLDPLDDAPVLERITEIAVIISLFTAGLKLRLPIRDPRWWLTFRLAFVAMAVTVGLVTLAGYYLIGVPLGVAVLLGAILAPTDPVLASDVQLRKPTDPDPLRFSLTSEAGLNDGTAFPFVMLGLGIIGLHEIGPFGWRWFTVDLLWAVAAGIGTGVLLGTIVGHIVLYLRREYREGVGLDDFLALGLIATSYGMALLIHAYGFLAVFAAGLAVRRIESRETGDEAPPDVRLVGSLEEAREHEDVTHPERAHAYMTEAVLFFNEQIDRIGAMFVLLLVGAMLSSRYLHPDAIWFVPMLLFAIRPVSVWISLLGTGLSVPRRNLISWFGVRGIGSMYYLSFAIAHGLPFLYAEQLATMTISVIIASVVLHGISVTPLMGLYDRRWTRSHTRHAQVAAGARRDRSVAGGT